MYVYALVVFFFMEGGEGRGNEFCLLFFGTINRVQEVIGVS